MQEPVSLCLWRPSWPKGKKMDTSSWKGCAGLQRTSGRWSRAVLGSAAACDLDRTDCSQPWRRVCAATASRAVDSFEASQGYAVESALLGRYCVPGASLLAGPDIKIRSPTDSRVRFIIDSVATYVLVDGCAFEQAIMTKEAGNPEFMFLFDLQCPEHAYYRWRLYSLAQVLSQLTMVCQLAQGRNSQRDKNLIICNSHSKVQEHKAIEHITES